MGINVIKCSSVEAGTKKNIIVCRNTLSSLQQINYCVNALLIYYLEIDNVD